MKSPIVMGAMVLLTVAATQAADAPAYERHIPAKLAAEAKVSEAAALEAARHEVPAGKVVAVELERERGTLMYSIDLQVPGADGVDEVEVDASDGRVIGTEHESAAREKAETARDKKQGAQHL
jgi:uncharacterized membrane protein YkoI